MTEQKRMFETADRRRLVEESDPEAAFLAVNESGVVDAEVARRHGIKQVPLEYDVLKRERELLADAESRGAFEEARVRRQLIVSMEAERKLGGPDKAMSPADAQAKTGLAAQRDTESKMMDGPAENKARTRVKDDEK